MVRIQPSDLIGPTAYFTDFDYRLLSRISNIEAYSRKAERKLKSLLLLKTNITYAASHLTSTFAYNFFKNNPVLLNCEAIVPAFRSDKKEIDELFEKKNIHNKNEIINFYKDNIHRTVNWDLIDNSGWFKNRFLDDINNQNSVLNRNIVDKYQYVLKEIAQICEKDQILDRKTIDKIVKNIPLREKKVILNYRELLYHISGARVVNSESALPQENYIDYDLADIEKKRVKLTEDQILTKLLIETVFDSLSKSVIPVDVLDILSFNDIIKIREPLLNSEFRKKYDSLTKKVVDSYSTSFEKVFNLSELVNIRNDLSKTFKEIIEKELPTFLRKNNRLVNRELIGSSTSVALGLLSKIPVVGPIFGTASILKDSKALIINVKEKYMSLVAIKRKDEYYRYKKSITKYIISCKRNDKTELIDFVDYLTAFISEKIKIP